MNDKRIVDTSKLRGIYERHAKENEGKVVKILENHIKRSGDTRSVEALNKILEDGVQHVLEKNHLTSTS